MNTLEGNHRFTSTTTSGDSTYSPLDIGQTPSLLRPDQLVPPTLTAASAKAQVEKAVFAHIQAMRTLGRTTLNTSSIAKALMLPQSVVDRAVTSLRGRGVKVVGR